MLGITIRLGASKDQIVETKTGFVFADRYEARNRVKRVQGFKVDPDGKPFRRHVTGEHYEAAPDHSYLKACHAVVMQAAHASIPPKDAARRGYGRAA